MHSERLPFISQGGAYTAVGSPTGGSNVVVLNIVLSIHYALQAMEISLLDPLPAPGALHPPCPSAVLSGRCQMQLVAPPATLLRRAV